MTTDYSVYYKLFFNHSPGVLLRRIPCYYMLCIHICHINFCHHPTQFLPLASYWPSYDIILLSFQFWSPFSHSCHRLPHLSPWFPIELVMLQSHSLLVVASVEPFMWQHITNFLIQASYILIYITISLIFTTEYQTIWAPMWREPWSIDKMMNNQSHTVNIQSTYFTVIVFKAFFEEQTVNIAVVCNVPGNVLHF